MSQFAGAINRSYIHKIEHPCPVSHTYEKVADSVLRLLELAEECNFRCVDVEYILGSDDLTPNPTINSCSAYEAYFSDELTTDDQD